jgi:drug/metabolite transporter (DMT)-like permease
MSSPTGAGRPPGLAEFALLVSLACVWGSSFLFIKIAVSNGLSPLSLATLRIAIGAAILLALARGRGQAWPRGRAVWGRIFFLGLMGNPLPFFLIGWGEQFTTSQLAAILMATIPLLVAILAHVMTADEKLTRAKMAGVLLGFAGVVVLVGVDALRGLGAQVLGQLAIFLACCCYSTYGVNVKKLPAMGPEMTVGIILAVGLAMILPFWLFVDRPFAGTWRVSVTGYGWACFRPLWGTGCFLPSCAGRERVSPRPIISWFR